MISRTPPDISEPIATPPEKLKKLCSIVTLVVGVGAFGGAAGMRFRKLQLWADELGLGGAFSSHIPTCDALT